MGMGRSLIEEQLGGLGCWVERPQVGGRAWSCMAIGVEQGEGLLMMLVA